MKKQIAEEVGKFKTIREGTESQLLTLLLADIIASCSTKGEDDKIDFSGFDVLAAQVKEMIVSVGALPDLDLLTDVQSIVDNVKQIRTECDFSLRSLSWVQTLLEEENKDA